MVTRRLLIFSLIFASLGLSLPALSSDLRGIESSPGLNHSYPFGKYYGLIIGINAYKEWNPLKTAVNDATKLKQVLINKYGFKEEDVIIRTDNEATRNQLIGDLRNIASKLKEQDNFLIYFAGHGQLDELTGDGYWIPVEGKLKATSSWISHSIIKNILSSEKVKGKNIVVIADSCYSGTLLRGGRSSLSLTEHNYNEKLLDLAVRRSRQVITSGGLEPVADGGRDGHSLFGYYFLKALEENEREIVDLENLFHNYVWGPVTEIGSQRPNIGRLKTTMDEDGQFVLITVDENIDKQSLHAFSSQNDQKNTEVELLFWNSIKDSNNKELFIAYLEKFPNGSFNRIAKKEIKELSQIASNDENTEVVFNPEESWTGIWMIESTAQQVDGVWALKQDGETVRSTAKSSYKLKGKVQGNQLKGWMPGIYGSHLPFTIKMAPDSMSFKGTVDMIGRNYHINGKRIE